MMAWAIVERTENGKIVMTYPGGVGIPERLVYDPSQALPFTLHYALGTIVPGETWDEVDASLAEVVGLV